MTAKLVLDQNNALQSAGTVIAAQLPVGWRTADISDADFVALSRGTKIYDQATQTLIANPALVSQVNQQAIIGLVAPALTRLQQIIDTPPLTFTNVAQAQTAVQGLQVAVQDEAKVLRRLVRLAANVLDGTA